MKVYWTLLFLMCGAFFVAAQTNPMGNSRGFSIDGTTTILGFQGDTLTLAQFTKMMRSKEWTMEPKFTSDGSIEYIRMKPGKPVASIPARPKAKVGEKLPQFEALDINGNRYDRTSIAGKVVVLNFWFTACKPCVFEMPELNDLYKKYQDRDDVVFLSFAIDDKEKILNFLNKRPFDYPIVASANPLISEFGVDVFPTNVVIDRKGNYYGHFTGAFEGIGEQLDFVVAHALKGVEPPPTFPSKDQ